jgi:type II secretory pathway pseudopilin PulG
MSRLSRYSRTGLSLLELLVVLTILVAIGGIVVSSLPGLLQRTRSATAAANVPELNAAIRRKMLLNSGKLGNRFDSLIAAGSSKSIPSYVGGKDFFEPYTLTQTDILALADMGLTQLVPALETASDATFESHTGLAVDIGNSTRVCALESAIAPETMDRTFNFVPADGERILVFGIGSRCSLVGAGPEALFAEAPVHFSDRQTTDPKRMYARYLILLSLKPGAESSEVRFLGVAIPGPSGVHALESELREFYNSGK